MTATRSPITTHVLDLALGRPARGVGVTLSREEGASFVEIGRGETDADGRASQLLPPGPLAPGTFRIAFDVARYFEESGRASFYPRVEIVFSVAAGAEHYHVPLLLSPFGYSTYRGS